MTGLIIFLVVAVIVRLCGRSWARSFRAAGIAWVGYLVISLGMRGLSSVALRPQPQVRVERQQEEVGPTRTPTPATVADHTPASIPEPTPTRDLFTGGAYYLDDGSPAD